jgi:hypothetical protein
LKANISGIAAEHNKVKGKSEDKVFIVLPFAFLLLPCYAPPLRKLIPRLD